MKEYLYFEQIESKTKTQIWHVHSKNDGFCLGEIKWYAPWRQYCFYPTMSTVWSRSCFKQVFDFIENLMVKKKEVQLKKIDVVEEKNWLHYRQLEPYSTHIPDNSYKRSKKKICLKHIFH